MPESLCVRHLKHLGGHRRNHCISCAEHPGHHHHHHQHILEGSTHQWSSCTARFRVLAVLERELLRAGLHLLVALLPRLLLRLQLLQLRLLLHDVPREALLVLVDLLEAGELLGLQPLQRIVGLLPPLLHQERDFRGRFLKGGLQLVLALLAIDPRLVPLVDLGIELLRLLECPNLHLNRQRLPTLDLLRDGILQLIIFLGKVSRRISAAGALSVAKRRLHALHALLVAGRAEIIVFKGGLRLFRLALPPR
mmetsp:Transcript_77888/g.252507  ORF Transcript_77888/g.252507 Transcript_77888/m.252507 type:complete len:251 (+) Transcript_77888:73-825(+)